MTLDMERLRDNQLTSSRQIGQSSAECSTHSGPALGSITTEHSWNSPL